MSKRLAFLEKLVADGKADSFGMYGLALEYRSLGRLDDALATFQTLRERDPDYVAMYLMAGQILVERGDKAGAITWLDQGLSAAAKKRDSHATSELQSLRDTLLGARRSARQPPRPRPRACADCGPRTTDHGRSERTGNAQTATEQGSLFVCGGPREKRTRAASRQTYSVPTSFAEPMWMNAHIRMAMPTTAIGWYGMSRRVSPPTSASPSTACGR